MKTGQRVILRHHDDVHTTIYEVKSTNGFTSELTYNRGPHKLFGGIHENSTLKEASKEQIKYAKSVGQY